MVHALADVRQESIPLDEMTGVAPGDAIDTGIDLYVCSFVIPSRVVCMYVWFVCIICRCPVPDQSLLST